MFNAFRSLSPDSSLFATAESIFESSWTDGIDFANASRIIHASRLINLESLRQLATARR